MLTLGQKSLCITDENSFIGGWKDRRKVFRAGY